MNKLYTIGLLFLTFFSALAQTNLVANGGFEGTFSNNMPFGWVDPNNATQNNVSISLITNAVYEGTKALKLSTDQVTGIIGEVSQIVPGIEAAAKYEVSFWYKYLQPDAGSSAYRVMQWFDATNTDIPPVTDDESFFGFESAPYLAQNIWVPLTVIVTAPTTATKLFLDISSGGVINFAIDDVKVLKQAALGINDLLENKINMYAIGNTLYVATEGGEQLSVYNIMGQKVRNTIANTNTAVTLLNDLPVNQILIIRVDNKYAKVILK